MNEFNYKFDTPTIKALKSLEEASKNCYKNYPGLNAGAKALQKSLKIYSKIINIPNVVLLPQNLVNNMNTALIGLNNIKNATHALKIFNDEFSTLIKELNASIVASNLDNTLNSLSSALASVNEHSSREVVVHNIKRTQSVLKELRKSTVTSSDENYNTLQNLETYPLKPLSPKIKREIESLPNENDSIKLIKFLNNNVEIKDGYAYVPEEVFNIIVKNINDTNNNDKSTKIKKDTFNQISLGVISNALYNILAKILLKLFSYIFHQL